MIEQVLTGGNLLKAMSQVQRNRGSAGIDHMPVTKLTEIMSIDRVNLIERVRSGKLSWVDLSLSSQTAVMVLDRIAAFIRQRLKAQNYINDGYQYIVDIDLKNFFDEVDHALLLELLYRKIKCRETMRLIRKWLRAPICINGKLYKRLKGMPQGGLCITVHKPP